MARMRALRDARCGRARAAALRSRRRRSAGTRAHVALDAMCYGERAVLLVWNGRDLSAPALGIQAAPSVDGITLGSVESGRR